MRENILLVRKNYCVSCADFWVLSILGLPACRDYVIDPLLAASACPGRTRSASGYVVIACSYLGNNKKAELAYIPDISCNYYVFSEVMNVV